MSQALEERVGGWMGTLAHDTMGRLELEGLASWNVCRGTGRVVRYVRELWGRGSGVLWYI